MDKIRLAKTLIGEPREYFEFIINEKPLLKYFTEVYENWKDDETSEEDQPRLDASLIGVLHSNHSWESQMLSIRALLQEPVTLEECHSSLASSYGGLVTG